jgi:hypothetical protein
MGTWERGNFLVKTTTDDKPLGNFIDCERGKSKEHKCERNSLGRSCVAMEKKV